MAEFSISQAGITLEGIGLVTMAAIAMARDQDRTTWITEDGRRVAAIVPVDTAEIGDARKLT